MAPSRPRRSRAERSQIERPVDATAAGRGLTTGPLREDVDDEAVDRVTRGLRCVLDEVLQAWGQTQGDAGVELLVADRGVAVVAALSDAQHRVTVDEHDLDGPVGQLRLHLVSGLLDEITCRLPERGLEHVEEVADGGLDRRLVTGECPVGRHGRADGVDDRLQMHGGSQGRV